MRRTSYKLRACPQQGQADLSSNLSFWVFQLTNNSFRRFNMRLLHERIEPNPSDILWITVLPMIGFVFQI